jgi:orotate phosphoribosyltransferase
MNQTEFDQVAFNEFVADNGVYGFFDEAITLKSGRQSHYYANWRNVVEDVYLTKQLVEYVITFVLSQGIEVDTFFGVPEGATKLGVITQYTWARQQGGFGPGSHVLAMGRARPKEHGVPKDRYFVGMPRGRVVVLEDATTTGGSAIKSLKSLKQAGVNVTTMISLTNRMEKRDDGLSVKQAVEELGIAFLNMSTALDILPLVYRTLSPGEQIARAIEDEYTQYGVEPIKLL